MHAWRLGFGSVVMAVSAVSWLGRAPQPGPGHAAAPEVASVGPVEARCLLPPSGAPARTGNPSGLLPLQAQALPERTVVLVGAPVALAVDSSSAGLAARLR